MIRRILPLLFCLLLLTACTPTQPEGAEQDDNSVISIVATTYPIYLFASEVTKGVEGVSVAPLVNQGISCLHDYTLTTNDMKLLDGANILIRNGAGLDDFVLEAAVSKPTLTIIDCSKTISPIDYTHSHGDEPFNESGLEEDAPAQGEKPDASEMDPHFWMDPARAAAMVETISTHLSELDPANAPLYQENSARAAETLLEARDSMTSRLNTLFCRELITFHDGFAYFAEAFNLTILMSVEEEEGLEASAKVIQEAITYIDAYGLPAIFTEVNSSDATAQAITRETEVTIYTLSMIMSGNTENPGVDTYLSELNSNINTIMRALQ